MASCINLKLPIVIVKQDVRLAYKYFFSEQECDLVTVLLCINLTLLRKVFSKYCSQMLGNHLCICAQTTQL